MRRPPTVRSTRSPRGRRRPGPRGQHGGDGDPYGPVRHRRARRCRAVAHRLHGRRRCRGRDRRCDRGDNVDSVRPAVRDCATVGDCAAVRDCADINHARSPLRDRDLDRADVIPATTAPNQRVVELATGVADEASGIAVSAYRPGGYFLVDDATGTSEVVAVSADGAVIGRYAVQGMAADNAEALGSGTCGPTPAPGAEGQAAETCLYVGDIGDNKARRPDVVIYRMAEPDPASPPVDPLPADEWHYSYPDGPHNAEAMLVSTDGSLLIVTKPTDGLPHRMYRATPGGGELEFVREFRPPAGERGLMSMLAGDVVTDLASAPGRVLLLTYGEVQEYTAPRPRSGPQHLPGLAAPQAADTVDATGRGHRGRRVRLCRRVRGRSCGQRRVSVARRLRLTAAGHRRSRTTTNGTGQSPEPSVGHHDVSTPGQKGRFAGCRDSQRNCQQPFAGGDIDQHQQVDAVDLDGQGQLRAVLPRTRVLASAGSKTYPAAAQTGPVTTSNFCPSGENTTKMA